MDPVIDTILRYVRPTYVWTLTISYTLPNRPQQKIGQTYSNWPHLRSVLANHWLEKTSPQQPNIVIYKTNGEKIAGLTRPLSDHKLTRFRAKILPDFIDQITKKTFLGGESDICRWEGYLGYKWTSNCFNLDGDGNYCPLIYYSIQRIKIPTEEESQLRRLGPH